MAAMTPALEHFPEPRSEDDEVHAAIEHLRGRFFRRRGQDQVLVDFLEDELREGQQAVDAVAAYFDEVLATLRDRETTAAGLIDLADDSAVLDRLEDLEAAVGNLRKRLLKVAARVAG